MVLAGILLFLAGAYLLWQARREIIYWLAQFFSIFRREFGRRSGLRQEQADANSVPEAGTLASPAQRSGTTLRLVTGVTLIFLGQFLILLQLAF